MSLERPLLCPACEAERPPLVDGELLVGCLRCRRLFKPAATAEAVPTADTPPPRGVRRQQGPSGETTWVCTDNRLVGLLCVAGAAIFGWFLASAYDGINATIVLCSVIAAGLGITGIMMMISVETLTLSPSEVRISSGPVPRRTRSIPLPSISAFAIEIEPGRNVTLYRLVACTAGGERILLIKTSEPVATYLAAQLTI